RHRCASPSRAVAAGIPAPGERRPWHVSRRRRSRAMRKRHSETRGAAPVAGPAPRVFTDEERRKLSYGVQTCWAGVTVGGLLPTTVTVSPLVVQWTEGPVTVPPWVEVPVWVVPVVSPPAFAPVWLPPVLSAPPGPLLPVPVSPV